MFPRPLPRTFGAYGGITLPTVFRPVGYAGYFVLGHFLYERRAWLKGRLLAALLATGTAAAACATWLTLFEADRGVETLSFWITAVNKKT